MADPIGLRYIRAGTRYIVRNGVAYAFASQKGEVRGQFFYPNDSVLGYLIRVKPVPVKKEPSSGGTHALNTTDWK